MPRRRKRARSANAGPLLLLALGLCALVIWAILPHAHSRRTVHRRIATVPATPIPSPQARAAQSPVPQGSPAVTRAQPAPSPLVTPSASAPVSPSGAQVAIIIDDCGQWLNTERGYIDLPIPLTLSVLPHVRYTSLVAREAAAAGKGVMLHLPMEPISHAYPGPGEIKIAMSDDAVDRQTEDDVAQVPLARGVNNHEGSLASADPRVMKDVIGIVKEHDLFFVDSRTNAASIAAEQAREAGVPNASRDVFLDNEASVTYTEAMLEKTLAVAKRSGTAIAIGHPKPSTLQALRAMYPKMQAAGVQFVLVSQLVH